MKKFICALAVCSMLFPTVAFAQETVKVNVNGKSVAFDREPIIEEGRVLVPLRAVFEALDCRVTYEESGDTKTVTARKGTNFLNFTIGDNTLYTNNDTVTLDVPAKIIEGRTYVPVRAISEGIGADVNWDDETKTVIVETKQGDHTITSVKAEKEFKAEDGTKIADFYCAYPVIENADGDEKIAEINAAFKAVADEFEKEVNDPYLKDAKEYYEATLADEEMPFHPYVLTLDYDVNTDKNGIVSVTFFSFYNTMGAHPMTAKKSMTFDTATGKELALSDIGEVDDKIIAEAFDEFVKENGGEDGYAETLRNNIISNKDYLNFCVTDDGVELYYQLYQVAPYAMGYPTGKITYNDSFKIELSK